MNTGFDSTLARRVRLLSVGIIIALLGVSCGGFFVEPEVALITINPATPSLLTGNAQQFTAVATYNDGTRKVLSEAMWASSNAAVLYVNAKGMATAVAAGSATVSASSDLASGSTSVSVVDSPITSIVLSPINPSITMAQRTQQFSATATFGDGSSRDVSSSVTWTSVDTAVATISSTGLATAAKAGTTLIRAVTGTQSASTTLTVLP